MINLLTYPLFKLDRLNGFVALGVVLFFALTFVYSLKFMKGKSGLVRYYIYITLTAVASLVVALANNFILLLASWGFLGLLLYLLINMGDEGSSRAAKKALIIVGGTDALMILGIAIIYYFTGNLHIDQVKLDFNNGLSVLAYITIAIACFAKAGAMPFHSWIPDCAKSAPLPVTAYLPASLDKLLGIYLLVRASLDLFVMNRFMNNLLMLIGAMTIIAGVMMALVQHNLKKLLGYHAVSQVGYMVLGIGTGNPIGIAGGIFHMLNNTLYKSCLFFTAGNVEYRAKTTELDQLGGLAKFMPITYLCCLVASFSISGIPPFNGFVSKWMIYQGMVVNIRDAGSSLQSLFSVICLAAAMFGSGLTLASFMKVLHSVFLGQRAQTIKDKDTKEAPLEMIVPCIILAAICILFGVFAFTIPLKYFILPAVSTYQHIGSSDLLGIWYPVQATVLIVLGLILGLVFFRTVNLRPSLRQDNAFVGGEASASNADTRVTGIDFYNTVKEMGFLRGIYKKAESGVFDIYEQGKKRFSLSKGLQYLHNGVVPTYLVWMLLGMVGLLFILVR